MGERLSDKNSEYDKEIPHSQTHGIVRKSRRTISRHQEDKQNKTHFQTWARDFLKVNHV